MDISKDNVWKTAYAQLRCSILDSIVISKMIIATLEVNLNEQELRLERLSAMIDYELKKNKKEKLLTK